MKSEEKTKIDVLFPILQPRLTGIARLAAEAVHADAGHQVEFRAIEARSILSRVVSKRQLLLDYSINPYRGCEFGCRYCYARYTHEFLAPKPNDSDARPALLDPQAFERIIFLKQNAAWLLEQDLKRVDPSKEIALGTATDPYQPIERRAKITRSLLEVFARKQGYKVGIVTKSNLIERDIDLLAEIARRNTLVVHITITTPDADLARKLEPRAPRPDLRFAAVRKLRDAGIMTGVLCCPLMPGINDSNAAIDDMARRAAEAGASFFAGNPLFLKPCSRPTYVSFLREHFPELLADYEVRFGKADFADQAYARQLGRTVALACGKYGLRQRSHDALVTREPDFIGPENAQSRIPPGKVTAGMQQRLFA